MDQNQRILTADTQKVVDAVSTFMLSMMEIINGKRLSEKAGAVFEPVLSKQQLAEHFGVGVRTVENWTARGCVPYYKVGKIVRFRLSDVLTHWDASFRVRRGTFGRATPYRP